MGEVRRAAKSEEEGQLEKVLRRTRVVVLGKRTEGRREGDQTIQRILYLDPFFLIYVGQTTLIFRFVLIRIREKPLRIFNGTSFAF